jgi:hypothetical protein
MSSVGKQFLLGQKPKKRENIPYFSKIKLPALRRPFPTASNEKDSPCRSQNLIFRQQLKNIGHD